MRKSLFTKRIIAYVCAATMVFSSFAGVSLKDSAQVNAATESKEVALQLAQDGVDKNGPQTVTGAYAYQGVFSIPAEVTADYKYLEMTYVGDISSLRLGSEANGTTTWFAENPQGTFKTADDSAIVLNAETETTVVIDLEKTGVSYVGGDTVHVHAGNGTDFTYEFKSVKLKTTADAPIDETTAAPVVGAKKAKLQLAQDGVDKNGPQTVTGAYAYQGVFSIPAEVTADYKYLAMTYVGDISSLRLEANGSTTWFAENEQGTFKTADDSAIVLNAETETTVVIDLEKTGVSYVGGNTVHVHAGNGTDFTYEFKNVELRTTAAPVIEPKTAKLQLAQDGVDKNGPQTVTGAYAYQGVFSIPAEVTADYKYLEMTYVGDISSLRLASEANGTTTWFAENAEGTFKTADDSVIVLNAETETKVIIDLEKTGVSYVGGDTVHVHAGNGTDFTYEFKSVYLKTTADATVEETTAGPTTDAPTTAAPTTAEPTTAADPSTGIKLDDAASGMNKTLHIDKLEATSKDEVKYAYLGFVTFKDLATKDFKYLKLTYTGDITSLRFEFNHKETNTNQGPFWFDPEQELHFVTKDGSAIPMVGNNTTIVIDLEASGVDMAKYNNGIHMHGNSTKDAAFDVTLKDGVLFGGVPTPKPTTAAPTVAPTKRVVAPNKVTVKSASKKKASTRVKISLKKLSKAKGYYVQISTSKKFQKKRIIVKKYVKKATFLIKSKKLKNKKTLYVRVKAYKLNGKKKVYSKKWSRVKKVKIKR